MAYIQVYTGTGKGKTTAAIGLSVRALGAGKRVLFLQFMKESVYSEHKILKNISDKFTLETVGKPYFIARKEDLTPEMRAEYGARYVMFEKGNPPVDYVELIDRGIRRASDAVRSGDYDLVVLDEINCALFFELVSETAVLALLENRAPNTEVVLTGRNAPASIIAYADLVTEMREVKHYYTQGVEARKGIES